MVDQAVLDMRRKLIRDFEYYSKGCLKIRPKTGGVIPFKLNSAQRYLHDKIEAQKREKGHVRAIVLKGRQQGCSTYVEGRFYWIVSQSFGSQAFILTHQQAATDNLFSIVQRYHENCPDLIRPLTSSASSKELFFKELDSGYKVGTAGSKGVGRSSTIQLFHGSEVAFWPHAAEHAAGIMNAIPDAQGTEIILESTANGIGNYFHDQWQMAARGESDFEAIFIPWYWQEEYRIGCESDFQLTEEEKEIASRYDLTNDQMNWRRKKIREFEGVGGEILFKQEYPFTPDEAFQVSSAESFIPASIVLKAAENRWSDGGFGGNIIIGVDPARYGADNTGIVIREGLKVHDVIRLNNQSTMSVVGYVMNLINEYHPAAIFIDEGGLGAGIIDRFEELQQRSVIGVNFGSKAEDDRQYCNKRAEMWGRMREWLKRPVVLPGDQALLGEIMVPHFGFTSSGQLKLESKESIKGRGFKSPDLADALALTFAYHVGDMQNGMSQGHVIQNRVYQGAL